MRNKVSMMILIFITTLLSGCTILPYLEGTV